MHHPVLFASPREKTASVLRLQNVEPDLRTLEHALSLRPLDHRPLERKEVHVLLCWMALLLVRLIERGTDGGGARMHK